MLKFCSPYLSTLIIGPNLVHKCTTVLLPPLCKLKLAHSEIGFYQHGLASQLQILNGLPTEELFVNSMCLAEVRMPFVTSLFVRCEIILSCMNHDRIIY